MSIFDTNRLPNLKYNNFKARSYQNFFTAKMGVLTPCFLQETIPGDKMRLRTDCLIRLQPKLAPAYENLYAFMHYYKVPMRLLMEDGDFEKMFTGGRTGSDYRIPPFITPKQIYQMYLNFTSTFPKYFGAGTLWDYLGYPVVTGAVDPSWNALDTVEYGISLLPILAYQKVFDEYFKDENLSSYEFELLPSGKVDLSTSTKQTNFMRKYLLLQNRCYSKDYFTSALPFAQRGTQASVPVTADIVGHDDLVLGSTAPSPTVSSLNTNLEFWNNDIDYVQGTVMTQDLGDGEKYPVNYQSGLGVENASFLINELREAEASQRYEEASARGGFRLPEFWLSHFGVRSSDASLQRAQFLGGSMQGIVISEVLANASTQVAGVDTPLGTMAGHGISMNNMKSFRTYTEEPCFIIGIFSIIPVPIYSQGLNRMFTRLTRFDFYTPEFAHLGEQAICNREIYFDMTKSYSSIRPLDTFGYAPRYADYKSSLNQMHGDFRNSLSHWMNTRVFSSLPALNESFVSVPDLTGNFAVTTGDHYLVQQFHHVKLRSKMSYYGTPRIA